MGSQLGSFPSVSPRLRGGAHVGCAGRGSGPADRGSAGWDGGRAHRCCQAGLEARRRAGRGRWLHRLRAVRALRSGAGAAVAAVRVRLQRTGEAGGGAGSSAQLGRRRHRAVGDRKSTRLNSSHLVISYAVFCLKKKKQTYHTPTYTPHPTIHTNPPYHSTLNPTTPIYSLPYTDGSPPITIKTTTKRPNPAIDST